MRELESEKAGQPGAGEPPGLRLAPNLIGVTSHLFSHLLFIPL